MAALTRTIHILAFLLFALGPGSCGGDECEGDCTCEGGACVCPSTGVCLVDCTADCDLQCAGSGDCDFLCGDGCLAACTGSGFCVVDVGADSQVDCPGQGGCEVICHGDCNVDCRGSGECVVHCDPEVDAACDFDSCSGAVVECEEDVMVCNGECP
jgi:hypothetical protein